MNRNYGYKFGFDSIGSSNRICEEDYRGSSPFSEPETQAIKSAIELRSPRIISAMNFHCYGNLWIHPFNYSNEPDNLELKQYEQFEEIYDHLHSSMKFPSNALVGNAKKLIDYVANGEASDWMFAEKKIISWSPELGNRDHTSDNFYIDASIHETVIKDDYIAIEGFIFSH